MSFSRARSSDVVAAALARAVVAVGEHDDHAPAILGLQVGDALVDRVPEPRRIAEVEILLDDPNQPIAVVRERLVARQHLDLVVEGADLGLVLGQQADEELLGRLLHELHVQRHAAARVEHDDGREGRRFVDEVGQRLQLAVVVHLEILLLEIGDEPPLPVDDRRVDGHGLRGHLDPLRQHGHTEEAGSRGDGQQGSFEHKNVTLCTKHSLAISGGPARLPGESLRPSRGSPPASDAAGPLFRTGCPAFRAPPRRHGYRRTRFPPPAQPAGGSSR